MRTTIRGSMCAVGVAAAIALAGSAQAKNAVPEKGLLGVRLLRSYKTVMAKYGQPQYVFRIWDSIQFNYQHDALGKFTGEVIGIGGSTAGAAPATTTSMVSAPAGGAPGAGAPAGGRRTFPKPAGGAPSGAQVSAPGIGAGAASGGSSLPGSTGSAPAPTGNTFQAAGGFKWVYVYPAKGLAYEFYFNTDGRVVGIVERGRINGFPTSRGLRLDSPVRATYAIYGWPDEITPQGPGFALYFGQKYHAGAYVVDNRVKAICVFLDENRHVNFYDSTVAPAGGFGTAATVASAAAPAGGGRSFPRPAGLGGGGGGGGAGASGIN